jgi:hypothetical protein
MIAGLPEEGKTTLRVAWRERDLSRPSDLTVDEAKIAAPLVASYVARFGMTPAATDARQSDEAAATPSDPPSDGTETPADAETATQAPVAPLPTGPTETDDDPDESACPTCKGAGIDPYSDTGELCEVCGGTGDRPAVTE